MPASSATQSDAPEVAPKSEPALRAVAMPADTNPHGDIFGGWLLCQMDLAGTIYSRRVYDDGLMVFPDESGRTFAAAFNTGLAGVGSLFLRLLHGGPRPLMADELLLPSPSGT